MDARVKPGHDDLLCQVLCQVTHRPACSRLATSVRTLTTGSQATGRSLPGLVHSGALRPAWATGMRTSTEVSVSPSRCSEMVRVGPPVDATTVARSALVARLIAGAVVDVACRRWNTPPVR